MQYSYLGLGNKMTTKEAGIKAKSAETSKKAASSAKGAPLTESELLKMSDKDYMSAKANSPVMKLEINFACDAPNRSINSVNRLALARS